MDSARFEGHIVIEPGCHGGARHLLVLMATGSEIFTVLDEDTHLLAPSCLTPDFSDLLPTNWLWLSTMLTPVKNCMTFSWDNYHGFLASQFFFFLKQESGPYKVRYPSSPYWDEGVHVQWVVSDSPRQALKKLEWVEQYLAWLPYPSWWTVHHCSYLALGFIRKVEAISFWLPISLQVSPSWNIRCRQQHERDTEVGYSVRSEDILTATDQVIIHT